MGDCETVVYKRRFLPGQESSCWGGESAVSEVPPCVLRGRVMLEIQALIQVREPRGSEWVRAQLSRARRQRPRASGPARTTSVA